MEVRDKYLCVVCALLCSAGADWSNRLHEQHLGPLSLAMKALSLLQQVCQLLSAHCLDLDNSFWIGSDCNHIENLWPKL